MDMEELCIEIINSVEDLLKSDTNYKDILEYLECKRIAIEVRKNTCSEYMDNLVKELK